MLSFAKQMGNKAAVDHCLLSQKVHFINAVSRYIIMHVSRDEIQSRLTAPLLKSSLFEAYKMPSRRLK